MVYIGNDIISLENSANRSSFSNISYIRKMLAESEFILYTELSRPALLPWLFWTCKESAYKIALKKGEKKGFSPALFEVKAGIHELMNIGRTVSGHVCYKQEKTFFMANVFSEFISTHACSDINFLEQVKCSNFKGQGLEQHEIARINLRQGVSIGLKIPETDIFIEEPKKSAPRIRFSAQELSADISFSYDEGLFSCAYLLFDKRK